MALLQTLIISNWVCEPAEDRTYYACRKGDREQVVMHHPLCVQREWIYRQARDQVRIVCRRQCHEN